MENVDSKAQKLSIGALLADIEMTYPWIVDISDLYHYVEAVSVYEQLLGEQRGNPMLLDRTFTPAINAFEQKYNEMFDSSGMDFLYLLKDAIQNMKIELSLYDIEKLSNHLVRRGLMGEISDFWSPRIEDTECEY